MKRALIIGLILALALAGCQGKEGQKISLQPFIGGTAGLTVDFIDFRKEVFDSGGDPFDIVVKLQNQGETAVAKNKIKVMISGIKPQEFNRVEDNMRKSPEEDILATTKDPQGKVINSPPVFVEFKEFNHVTPIAGSVLTFPIRAEICYGYSTQAVSKLCVRDNIISPKTGGLCEIEEAKPVYNSGAPVQIENVKETAGGQNKIRFSFDVSHKGTGAVFAPDTQCTETPGQRQKLTVRVNTMMTGLSCTGLSKQVGNAVEGITELFDNVKTISCSQDIAQKANYEFPIEVNVFYDYNDYKSTDLTVKHTGEVVTPTTPSGQ